MAFRERAADENLAHGRLLQGARLPILEPQRDGVGRGRVEAALDLPVFRGRFVLVQLHTRVTLGQGNAILRG